MNVLPSIRIQPKVSIERRLNGSIAGKSAAMYTELNHAQAIYGWDEPKQLVSKTKAVLVPCSLLRSLANRRYLSPVPPYFSDLPRSLLVVFVLDIVGFIFCDDERSNS